MTNGCGGFIIRSRTVSSSLTTSCVSVLQRSRSQRERAKAALDRARAQCGTVTTINSAKIDAFARLMIEKLDNGDTNARRTYIRSIIDTIEVDDDAIRIIGSKDVLQAVIAGKQTANGNVRGFVRKWRARRDSNS